MAGRSRAACTSRSKRPTKSGEVAPLARIALQRLAAVQQHRESPVGEGRDEREDRERHQQLDQREGARSRLMASPRRRLRSPARGPARAVGDGEIDAPDGRIGRVGDGLVDHQREPALLDVAVVTAGAGKSVARSSATRLPAAQVASRRARVSRAPSVARLAARVVAASAMARMATATRISTSVKARARFIARSPAPRRRRRPRRPWGRPRTVRATRKGTPSPSGRKTRTSRGSTGRPSMARAAMLHAHPAAAARARDRRPRAVGGEAQRAHAAFGERDGRRPAAEPGVVARGLDVQGEERSLAARDLPRRSGRGSRPRPRARCPAMATTTRISTRVKPALRGAPRPRRPTLRARAARCSQLPISAPLPSPPRARSAPRLKTSISPFTPGCRYW